MAVAKPKSKANDAKRKYAADKSREISADGREIGPLPKVKNHRRRAKGLKDAVYFHRTYFPNSYYLGFGQPHIDAIESQAKAIEDGGLRAIALMRGGGKSTITQRSAIRAVVYGLRRYQVLFNSTDTFAVRSLKSIWRELERNDLLLEDFPEVCWPIRCLEGIHQRARGQTLNGDPTRMEITDGHIVLPTVKGSKASGSVLQALGLTGAIKGLNFLSSDGTPIRPDLVLLDDCQTRESAKSPTQTDDRERIICDDVLGLAGPQTNIAAVFLCTPIYVNDLTERFLDRERHPEWNGSRTRMIEKFPTNVTWWDNYGEVRREGMRNGDGGQAANELYLAERETADEGCVLAWPDRVKDGDVSGVQTAMNLYLMNPIGFKSEYQCEPESARRGLDCKELMPAQIAGRVTGLERTIVPATCTRLTAFVDVGEKILWFVVVAWNEQFGGSVIDYGTWPQQNRTVFAKNDPRPSMVDLHPHLSVNQRVYAGLTELLPLLMGKNWPRQNGGEAMRIERLLVDSGDGDVVDAVYKAIARFPIGIYPSKGVGRSSSSVGVGRWKLRPGERGDFHWRLTAGAGKRGQQVQYDPDAWKSFTHAALNVPLGGMAGLSLFGSKAGQHELFSQHLSAEFSEPKMTKGDTYDHWTLKPDCTDNDWFDCVVGCAVAASVAGVKINATGYAEETPKPPPISLRELQEKNRAEKAKEPPPAKPDAPPPASPAPGAAKKPISLREMQQENRRNRR